MNVYRLFRLEIPDSAKLRTIFADFYVIGVRRSPRLNREEISLRQTHKNDREKTSNVRYRCGNADAGTKLKLFRYTEYLRTVLATQLPRAPFPSFRSAQCDGEIKKISGEKSPLVLCAKHSQNLRATRQEI